MLMPKCIIEYAYNIKHCVMDACINAEVTLMRTGHLL